MKNRNVTVLIADDHVLSSDGLRRVLEAHGGFEVLATVPTGLEAIASATATKPALAILDYDMPGVTGLEVMTELRRWSPRTRVCILTGSTSTALFRTLVSSGVDGLFLKSSDMSKICDDFLEIAAGKTVIQESLRELIDDGGTELSRREMQVLACIAEGLTNKAAGEKLGISVKTVESHRGSLMQKLDVNSTASLLVRAVRDGLISP